MQCLCEDCASEPAETYTTGFRLSCEARMVIAMGDLEARRGYLAEVEKRRGIAGAEQLKAAITAEWNKRKAA